jgi:signal transduction histidine kinase/ligand-binding sensor domain-containing protein/CheY-like chemotaxis protein
MLLKYKQYVYILHIIDQFTSTSLFMLVILLASLFINTQLLAQDKDLRFTYINTNNGLSNNTISCIMQDNMGFMWIGTMDGLNRYDGYNIKTFKKVLKDTNSIADNMIYSLFIDKQQQIWVGTQKGLCKYNSAKENFETYILDNKHIDLSISNRITGICEDSKNQLYATAEIGTVYLFNRKENSFIADTHNFTSIKRFIVDHDDNFWLGGTNGLYYFNKSNNKVVHYKTYSKNSIQYPISEVNTLFLEGDTIWIGTIQGRIYFIPKETMQIQLLNYNFENTYYISDIFKGSDGFLYISTTSALFVYDKIKESYTAYKYEKDNPTGLNTGGIIKVFEDRQGDFWVGTAQGGINLAIAGKAFNNYNMYSKRLKLDFNNINYTYEDSKGRLWLGSYDQSISILDRHTGKSTILRHNPKNPKSLCFGTVYSIFEDSKKNIWVGTYVGPLQRFDPQTNEFISYNFPFEKSNPRFGFDVRSMIEDERGILWILPHGSGMIKFNPMTGESKNFRMNPKDIKNSLADDWACQIILDRKKNIWIATPSGLSKFDPTTEKFTNFYHDEKDTNSLGNNFIYVIFEDSQDNMWIGSSFGLDMFDREHNKFIHFYEDNGLPSNQIKSIVEYKPGQLWIGTSYGLSRMNYSFDNKTRKVIASFRNYDKSDNLQDFVFFSRSACKTKDNNLIFGGENGIVSFSPEDIKDNTVIPDVYITKFKLNNKTVEIGEYDSLLTKSITYTNELKLRYDQNFITFEFIAVNYIAREKNKFKYKLEGFDADWIDAGTKREATYTNIDPGEYFFKVLASNNDGYWNGEGVSLKLIISPPFWSTWWFRILASLAFIILVIWYYYNRIKNYKEQNLILENKVEERTFELKELNQELLDKNTWISAQNKEIIEQNREINNKSEEIIIQKELLQEQNTKVEQAYEELTLYRTKLEEIVDERTKELILAKEKAEESDKLKSSFLANISHEIRTPLNSIIGFSNIIIEEKLTVTESTNYKHIISSSCNSLLKLISDIIDFSKIEAGHLEIFIEDVPIKNVLNEIKDMYNLEINNLPINEEERQLELIVNIDDNINSLVLSTDEHRLKQVLSILLNNSLKFTHIGSIEVGCKQKETENMVEFFVKDTGIGISQRNQSIIFQRFRKADDDKSNQYRGAGLGLSIAQHLISLLGGEIFVESEVGKGTSFYFTIPLKSDVKFTKSIPPRVNSKFNIPDLTGKIILIAEDDYSNYAYLERLLIKANSKIIHANDGSEVLKLINENPLISLILMDIKMPKMNGFEAFEKIKKSGIHIPVIAQTAYAFTSDMQRIKELGFNDYISKPINPAKLYSIVSKHLAYQDDSTI